MISYRGPFFMVFCLSACLVAITAGCTKQSLEVEQNSETPNPANQAPVKSRTKQPFKMKGFYVGMPMEEVEATMNSLKLGYRVLDQKTIIASGDPYFKVNFDAQNRLISLQINDGVVVNFLFNVTDLTVQEFAEEFVEGYHLPEMHPMDPTTGKIGWIYQDEQQDFEIMIFSVNGSKRLWLQAANSVNFN
jgi:hypothetical protein